MGGRDWRQLTNTVKRFARGGDAAIYLVTLATRLYRPVCVSTERSDVMLVQRAPVHPRAQAVVVVRRQPVL